MFYRGDRASAGPADHWTRSKTDGEKNIKKKRPLAKGSAEKKKSKNVSGVVDPGRKGVAFRDSSAHRRHTDNKCIK